MAQFRRGLFALATICCSWFHHSVLATACNGCVDLDELSFDKTISHFPYSVVKFDVAFPYGEKHEAFAGFAKTANKMVDDLLIATVGIKDYGLKENKALGSRFKIEDNKYPAIFLFKGNTKDFVQLPAYLDVTIPNLQKFVTDNSPLYIGLEGCLKQFNGLSKEYANLSNELQLETIATAEKLAQQLTKEIEKGRAKNYITFMRKIHKNGYNFVEEETKRLQRLRGGRVTEAKKEELIEKLNILETFRLTKPLKVEL